MDNGHALFLELARHCDGRPADDVLRAAINLIANCIRSNCGLRSEAEAKMTDLYGINMAMLMEHYDPVTGRRRSVMPFTQVIHPNLVRANGHT